MTELVRKPLLRGPRKSKFYQHDFQREDLAFLTELDASANWSEMGCMKTSTTEWLMQQKLSHIPNPRVLVVTTKSGKGTYYESLSEVLPDWTVYTVSPQKFQLVVGSTPVPYDVELPNPLYMRPVVVVAHYHCFTDRACIPKPVKGENGLPKYNEETGLYEMTDPRCARLMQMHWDMVVIDEAHRIKNHDAQWTRNIKKIKAEFKHLMTGTGIVNNPADAWSLLNWLYPKTYRSYWKFREYFCEEDDWSGYRKVVGLKPDKKDEFRELVRRIGVRRTMVESFPSMAEPIETVIETDLNPTQRKMYDEIKKNLATMDAQGVPLHSPNVLSMLNRLRQIAVATPVVKEDYFDYAQDRRIITVELTEPSSKLDAVMETLEGLSWGDDPEDRDQVVVFSNFKDPLKLLQTRLAKAKIPYLRLLANMNDKERYQLWHDEWPKKEHQVFLCTLSLGSESINLTSAHRAIFLDQSWSPVQNKQAIGRIYRPGQTGVAQLIYIRARNTVDFRIMDANEEKHGWFTQIFGEESDDDSVTV